MSSIRTDRANLILSINGQQAGSTLKDLDDKARDLKRQLSRIPVDHDNFKKVSAELKGVNSAITQTKELTKGVGTEMDKLRTKSGGLSQVASRITGIFAAIGGIGAIVNATRETEKLFAVLKNATGGSTSGALRIFNQLQDFAATTPFALNEVVGAFTKLQQRNFNPTIEQLRTMGDIAASSGKSIDQFVEAILDAQTGEMERLKEFGIVARKEGDNVTATFRGQSTTFKNTAENMNNYLLGLGKLPGILGSTDAVAQTVDGSLSNLGDNFTRLSANIGQSGGLLKNFIDFMNQVVGSIIDFMNVPLSDQLREHQVQFNALVGILQDVNTSEDTRNRAIAELQREYPEYIGQIDLHKASEAELNKILEDGNKAFTQRIFLQSREEKMLEFAKRQVTVQKLAFETEKSLRAAQQRPDSDRGIFDRSQADDIKFFQGILGGYQNVLGQVSEEQKAFIIEQEQFAQQLGVNLSESTGTGTGSGKGTPGGKVKKEAEAAAGSIAFLRKHISDLQKELENTPGQSKALAPMIEQIRVAEAALQALEDQIDRVKNPAKEVAPGLDEVTSALGPGGSQSGTQGLSALDQAELDGIVAFNDAKVGLEEQFLNDVNALRDRNSELNIERATKEAEFEAQIQDLKRQTVTAGINTVISLLSTDEKARKKHGAAIKALEIANVGVNLAAEISSIRRWVAASPANALFPGYAAAFGGIQIGIAIAQALAQTAKIAKAKYADGGYTGPGAGAPDSTGHRPVGVVHANEWVSPPWMTQHPVYGRYVGVLENVRRRGFADGGFTTTPSVSVLPGPSGGTDPNTMLLMATVANLEAAVRNFPRHLTADVSYLDIEDAGNTLNTIRDEASL